VLALRGSAALALGGGALAFPGTAQAATVATSQSCVRYVAGQPTFPVTATGFTPNTVVRVTADGALLGTGVSDVAGTFAAALPAPPPDGVRGTVTVAAADVAGVTAPPLAVAVVRFTVRIPRRARPSRRVAFRTFGFPNGAHVHLHVRRGARTLGSYRIGTAAGPCGIASRRLRYMPLPSYRTGSYEYVFTTSPRYAPAAEPAIRLRVLIARTLRSR